jgi:outer membrane phospholipase A
MKPIVKFGLSIIICVILFTNVITKNLKSKKKVTSKAHKTNSHAKKSKQLHLVKDHNGFKSSLNQVTRRNPTVTVSTKIGSEKLAAPPTIIHMGNSNTSNGPNIGTFGPSAEIVGMKIF